MPILYEDKNVVCDDEAISIHSYYFPMGSRRIAYSKIRGVEEHAMSTWAGNYRIWGASDPRYWFHLDIRRPQKTKAIIIDKGEWVKAVITPDDPEAVLRILREKTS